MRKILSIDGGGIKGVFPAAFLASIERDCERPLVDYFDLIVGTSTGGIIALGLGAGLSAGQILSFYESQGPVIFGGARWLGWIRQWFAGKFDSENLERALRGVLGDRLIGQSRTRLVIPSQNLETGEVHIFKTAHHERFVRDYRVQMVTAALATSAAPTFFPTHRTASSTPLIDGGIWANNPAGVAAVEAIGVLQWEPREILLLSLSCTSNPMNVNLARSLSMGRFYWGVNLLEIVGAGQASGALGMAQWLLGHERVYRVDPKMAVGKFGLDKTAEIASLKGLGDSEARKAAPALTRFFSEPSEQFVPFYSVSALG